MPCMKNTQLDPVLGGQNCYKLLGTVNSGKRIVD